MTSKNLLGVFTECILRSKMKWIKEDFNGLSQEAWIKNVQICQSKCLSIFQVMSKAI